MIILGVYEDDECQECVFVGNYKEVAEEFSMSCSSLRTSICRGQRIQGKKHKRYLVYRLYKEAKDEQI